MLHLKWKWVLGDGRFIVPMLEHLREYARGALVYVANRDDKDFFSESGGLRADKFDYDYFSLKFVIADYDNFDDGDTEVKERAFNSSINDLEI